MNNKRRITVTILINNGEWHRSVLVTMSKENILKAQTKCQFEYTIYHLLHKSKTALFSFNSKNKLLTIDLKIEPKEPKENKGEILEEF
jgi:hypothetical protein